MKYKGFQRNIEDFVCERCNTENIGDGYTNHCYMCLWSKHVDIKPGDRKESCQGLMKPIAVHTKDQDHVLTHKCEKCGFEKNNRVGKGDNFDEVVKIAKSQAQAFVSK